MTNYAYIDVGSNSVRLLLNGKKYLTNTQLAEKLVPGGNILPEAAARTSEAIKSFRRFALDNGADEVFVFATEAVRSANNGKDFAALLSADGITLDVLSPQTEAKIGFHGAYCGRGVFQAVLDVGGASSELAVGNEKGLVYSHSLPLGAVRIKDYSLDRREAEKLIDARVPEYGEVPPFTEMVTIGGTTSSLVAVRDGIEPYDPSKIHLKKITYAEMEDTVSRILATPVEKRAAIKGMHPQKTLILPAGILLVMGIMRYLSLEEITVSENDNLEGYKRLKENNSASL